MAHTAPKPPVWPDEIYDVFKDRRSARSAMSRMPATRGSSASATPTAPCAPSRCTTEEEGVALLAGAWLGGDRGALLMQSSGVGNCVNMLSLHQECRMPLLMLVTMRGEWGEFKDF